MLFPWTILQSRDRASLAAGLPHDSFDPEGSVFLGRDGSLGLVWQVETLDAETRSPADLGALSQRFAELFKHVPSGAAVQFVVLSDRRMGPDLEPWTKEPGPGGTPGERSAAPLVASHARILSEHSFDDEGRPFHARRLKLYLSVRIFPGLSPSPKAATLA